jgi:hypothetical protein
MSHKAVLIHYFFQIVITESWWFSKFLQSLSSNVIQDYLQLFEKLELDKEISL